MSCLRTLDEIRDAGRVAALALPAPTQSQADLVAALLAPYASASRAA